MNDAGERSARSIDRWSPLWLRGDDDIVDWARCKFPVVEIVADHERCLGIALALSRRVIDDDVEAEEGAQPAEALGDAPMSEQPQLRLWQHRFDIDAHRPAARHPGPQDLVIEVEIDDPRLAIPQCFERGVAHRRLGTTTANPTGNDFPIAVDDSLAPSARRNRTSRFDDRRDHTRLFRSAQSGQQIENILHWSMSTD